MPASFVNHYKTIGLKSNATSAEINERYDLEVRMSQSLASSSTNEIPAIHGTYAEEARLKSQFFYESLERNKRNAFEILLDPAKKEIYDNEKAEYDRQQHQKWLKAIFARSGQEIAFFDNSPVTPPPFLFICMSEGGISNCEIKIRKYTFEDSITLSDNSLDALADRATSITQGDYNEEHVDAYGEYIFTTVEKARAFNSALIVKVTYKDPGQLEIHPFKRTDILQVGTPRMLDFVNVSSDIANLQM